MLNTGAMSAKNTLEVGKGTVQNFLRFHCAVNISGKLIVTKKNLLDLLDRLQPSGPVVEARRQGLTRANFSKKLVRVVQDVETFPGVWNPTRSERGPDVYEVGAVKVVLKEFGFFLADNHWDDIIASLHESSLKGLLPHYESGGSTMESDSLAMEVDSQTDPQTELSLDVTDVASASSQHLVAAVGVAPNPKTFGRSSTRSSMDASLADIPETQSVCSSGTGTAKLVTVEPLGNLRKRKVLDEESAEFKNYQQAYGGFSWTDLIREIMSKDDQLDRATSKNSELTSSMDVLRKKNKLLVQQTRRIAKCVEKWKSKAETKQTARKTTTFLHGRDTGSVKARADATIEQKMAIVRTGREGSGRYLTVPSRISLSIRRNLSNIACGDLSLVLLDDASRWTIARAEVQAGACLIAAARAFHRNMLDELDTLRTPGTVDEPAVCIHSISQDATNGGIWQKRKLCALILESAFCSSLPKQGESAEFNNLFSSLMCVADCQPVGDATAAGTVALTHKMLGSVGCPSVYDLVTGIDGSTSSGSRGIPGPNS